MTALHADRDQIGRFVPALFRYADEGSYVSLCSFEHEPNKPPVESRWVEINGEGLAPVIMQAAGVATRTASYPRPAVFCPPIATFTSAKSRSDSNLRNRLVLSVECDEQPDEACRYLQGILGPSTVTVASGGQWQDPTTGELQMKVHLHWRLKEPTRTAEEHAKLKRVRSIATALVGGDASAVPLVHPLRWAGSWHTKAKPTMCHIDEWRDEVEIDLADALELLEQTASERLKYATGDEARRLRDALDTRESRKASGEFDRDPDAHDSDLEALADAIPNGDVHWNEFKRIGMAFHHAANGEAVGFNAFDRWTQKSAKYDADGTAKAWEEIRRSPPKDITIGSLIHRAQQAAPGFRLPSWGPAKEATAEPERSLAGATEEPPSSGTTETPWPEPLEMAAYHGMAGGLVATIWPETESAAEALLFQFIAAAGNAMGADAYARVGATRHPPRLFTVQVGPTAKGRKGTSWDLIREVLRDAAPVWSEDRMASGLSSGEGLIYAVRDPVTEEQPDKKTGENRTVVIDSGVNDKRLLVVETEFAKALRVMEREGNTLSSVLRDAWDKGDLSTLTKASRNRAKGAHISVIGHVTDDELRRYLDRTEAANGLANRILFVCVQRSKMLPRGGRRLDLTDITTRLREILAGMPRGEIGRTDAFWSLWEDRYGELSADRPGLLGAVLGRAEAQVLRMSLIYALLDRQAFIDEVHLRAALACWKYAEASARFIFGDSLGDPIADEILRALREAPRGMTRADLFRHFGKNKTSETIGRAVAALAKGNFVRMTKEPTAGRPVERWAAVR